MSFFILWKSVVDDFLALELLICCYLFLKFCCFLLCVGLFLNEKEQNVVLLGCKPGKLHRPSSQFDYSSANALSYTGRLFSNCSPVGK